MLIAQTTVHQILKISHPSFSTQPCEEMQLSLSSSRSDFSHWVQSNTCAVTTQHTAQPARPFSLRVLGPLSRIANVVIKKREYLVIERKIVCSCTRLYRHTEWRDNGFESRSRVRLDSSCICKRHGKLNFEPFPQICCRTPLNSMPSPLTKHPPIYKPTIKVPLVPQIPKPPREKAPGASPSTFPVQERRSRTLETEPKNAPRIIPR